MVARFGPAGAGRCVLLAMLAFPGIAHAQADHVRISINFGTQQPSATTFTAATTKPIYLETATFTTSYNTPKAQMFDGGVLVRVAGGFAVGVSLSNFSKSAIGAVTGSVPHPFFFNTPRTITGTTGSLGRTETAAHVQLGYIAASKHVDVAVTGGPSFFSVSQDLVSDVTFTDAYPYDTATFGTAAVTNVSTSKVGFNVGGDVALKFSRNVGVGGLIRYTKASMNFPLTGSASGISTDAGGLQAGGGVRFFF